MTPTMAACSSHRTAAAYSIPVPQSAESLTHVYYVVHRERYGIHEIIEQGIITNPKPTCYLEFEREWLEKHRNWSLTIKGFQQQVNCFKTTAIVADYLSKLKA